MSATVSRMTLVLFLHKINSIVSVCSYRIIKFVCLADTIRYNDVTAQYVCGVDQFSNVDTFTRRDGTIFLNALVSMSS